MLFFFLSFVFWGKAALACVVFEEALLCVRTFDAFVITRRRTARDLRDDIIRHIPLKTPLSLASHCVAKPFREHNNALFVGSFSLDFLSFCLFKNNARAREGRVLCSFKGFSGDEGAKKGFFVHTNNARASSGRLRKGRREEERARVECNRSRGMRK